MRPKWEAERVEEIKVVTQAEVAASKADSNPGNTANLATNIPAASSGEEGEGETTSSETTSGGSASGTGSGDTSGTGSGDT